MREISERTKSEERREVLQTVPSNGEGKATKRKVPVGPPPMDFANGLLENSDLKQPRRAIDFLISLASQTAFVILLILIPLCYTQAFNLPEFEKTMLVIPPPPPPPPRAVERVIVKPKASLFDNGRLIAPRAVPKHVAILKEASEESSNAAGAGGVPGGVAGGTLGGVLGDILGSGRAPVLPPPPRPVRSSGPLKVGGRVQAPRLIRKIQPQYPELAKETRTQGVVVLDCVIDQQGNVTQMKLVSGHPLLVQAALNAVRQWKYQPTLLNGIPVAVEMEVTVKFFM
jgi:periplasmic protein TonB